MAEAPRAILHVDMDAFFAAIEQRDDPSLRGRPVLVGGAGRRGVLTTASYEARPFGCRSAQPTAVALRLCPHAIIVRPRHSYYSEVSRQVFAILESFTPTIQPLSIDEAFLDVTGSIRLFGNAAEIARQIKKRIRAELSLTASIGVSFNKFLAKLASDLRKPDGLVEITRENLEGTLLPLPIERMWGVGPAAAARLHRIGVRTFADLLATPVETLQRQIGSPAARLVNLIRGIDEREVIPDSRARSISHEQTFGANLDHPDEARGVLLRHVEDVARRLRRHGYRSRSVTVKLRFGDFETISRSTTLEEPTDSTRELQAAAAALFDRWRAGGFRPLRLIGFSAAVAEGASPQLALFDDPSRRREARIDKATDAIVAKFGRDAIHRGG